MISQEFFLQFCFNILIYVLNEVNNINKKFEEDNVDVTFLGISINHALNTLKRYFCILNYFVEGVSHLTKFLKDSKDGFLENVDKEGTIHRQFIF